MGAIYRRPNIQQTLAPTQVEVNASITKLLKSDGSIAILSKGVSGSESRVSTFHSPVGGSFVYTVTPIVIA